MWRKFNSGISMSRRYFVIKTFEPICHYHEQSLKSKLVSIVICSKSKRLSLFLLGLNALSLANYRTKEDGLILTGRQKLLMEELQCFLLVFLLYLLVVYEVITVVRAKFNKECFASKDTERSFTRRIKSPPTSLRSSSRHFIQMRIKTRTWNALVLLLMGLANSLVVHDRLRKRRSKRRIPFPRNRSRSVAVLYQFHISSYQSVDYSTMRLDLESHSLTGRFCRAKNTSYHWPTMSTCAMKF